MTPAVSRETPPAPASAAEILGPAREDTIRFAKLLATAGVDRGLLGPREVPRLWERHLLSCAVAVAAVPEGAVVADVGSGAGLPGLVWALCRPDLTLILVEPMLRRVRFLSEAVDRLRLRNVEVLRARAEEVAGERSFPVVTARAVAPLARLAGWCLPLVGVGGTLLAFKGQSVDRELADALSTIRRLGGTVVGVSAYGEGVLEVPARLVRIVKDDGSRGSRSGVRHGG